jgi:DNA-binding CsgD family transcriptional regulator
VAARLGVSAFTVHDWIKRIYRTYRVSSRAELLAGFVRR